MSFASSALVPVLSSIRQLGGGPAFRRLSPVVLPSSQVCNSWRDGADSALPISTLCIDLTTAPGEVVSWGSVALRFSSDSLRSRRVTRSPVAWQISSRLPGCRS